MTTAVLDKPKESPETPTSAAPEKPKKLTREDVAKIEIGSTTISKAQSWTLLVAFMVTIFLVPVVQVVRELGRSASGERATMLPQSLEIFGMLKGSIETATEKDEGLVDTTFDANANMLESINSYETELEDESVLSKALLSPTQELLTHLGVGNEKAYLGKDGWLFYRPGLDYVLGPGFLEPNQLKKRSAAENEWQDAPQPDPRKGVLDFHKHLSDRRIKLILVPTPVKAMLDPEQFSGRYAGEANVLQNPSYDKFISEMREKGVVVFEPASVMRNGKAEFLKTDTHWRPDSMQKVANALAALVKKEATLESAEQTYKQTEETVTNLGDIAAMLKLPRDQKMFNEETVTVQPVIDGAGGLWRPDPAGEILLLGDSFSNIYSLDEMNWGKSAGLAEQLSFHLQRRIDAIRQNDNGSFATRQTLSRELARGNDRLADKKVVVWQFAIRELSVGDWKILPMGLGKKSTGDFIDPSSLDAVRATATVQEIGFIPRPGKVPYKDHIVWLHLSDLTTDDGSVKNGQTVAFMWSMRDNELTPAANLRLGQKINVTLQPWSKKADALGGIKRSEPEDDELLFAVPAWAEFNEQQAAAVKERSLLPWQILVVLLGILLPFGVAFALVRLDPSYGKAAKAPVFFIGLGVLLGVNAGDDLLKISKEKYEESAKTKQRVIKGEDGWIFLPSELRHLGAGKFWGDEAAKVSQASKAKYADPLPAILDFKAQLDKAGIELILLPIPPKAVIYPDKLDSTLDKTEKRADVHHQEFYSLLREKGINVLDLTDVLIKARKDDKLQRCYCKTDTHYSPTACRIAAELVSESLNEQEWLKSAEKVKIDTEEREFTITGDLTRMGELKGSETLNARFVGTKKNGILEPLETDRESPVLLLGDSHCLVFHVGGDMHTRGAGLADQLAAELGIAIDQLGVRGSGATPARISLMRKARSKPSYLKGKKCIIWCFTAREFTESSGWRNVPIVR